MLVEMLVHVAVGILFDKENRVLIALRKPHVHQGGKWEFPGGKVEKNESAFDALKREFLEELGVQVNVATPLFQHKHAYADKSVLLDIWRIADYTGLPLGREQQQIRWVALDDLSEYHFPDANQRIIEFLFNPNIKCVP